MAPVILEALKGRTFLLASLTEPTEKSIESAFTSCGCIVLKARSIDECEKLLLQNSSIECVIFGLNDELQPGTNFLRFCSSNGRGGVNVIFLCESPTLDFTMAYYEGAQLVFRAPFDHEDIVKSTALTCLSFLGVRGSDRKKIARAWVTYSLGAQEHSGFGANISLGGMFIGTSANTPAQDEKISFKALIGQSAQICLEGKAVVKWVRNTYDNGKPRGFGLQFDNLEKSMSDLLWQIIADL